MPFKSKAQRRKFAALLVEGKITPETYEEWNRSTGRKELPERVRKAGKKRATKRRRSTTRKRTPARTRARTRPRTRARKR
jgi:hypothetical protein